MTVALIAFLVIAIMSCIFRIVAVAQDRNLVIQGKVFFLTIRFIMIVWAVVLIVLLCVRQ